MAVAVVALGAGLVMALTNASAADSSLPPRNTSQPATQEEAKPAGFAAVGLCLPAIGIDLDVNAPDALLVVLVRASAFEGASPVTDMATVKQDSSTRALLFKSHQSQLELKPKRTWQAVRTWKDLRMTLMRPVE